MVLSWFSFVKTMTCYKMASIESNVLCAPGKKYFKFNLKVLTLVGLWRNERWPKKLLIIYDKYEYIMHILPIIHIVLTMIGTYQHRAVLTEFLANLDKNIVTLNFIAKYIIFTTKRKDLSILITEIMHSGDKITKKSVRLMSLHVIVVTGLTVACISTFSGSAFLNKEMLAEAWLPFDATKNMSNLFLSFQIVAITFLPCTLRGNAMQGLVCSLIMYLCEQLVELQKRIRSLKYSLVEEAKMRQEFKEIIIKHIRIMRYSKTMDTIFKEYFFIQNLAITVELCLNAVMITVVGFNQKKLLVSFLMFLCIALLNAFIYCYLGNELIIQSEAIAKAAYDSDWTSWPVGLQKDLLIIIRAAQKPLSLSAGGMATMSMQTFGQALYNGYSIFAVLNDAVD